MGYLCACSPGAEPSSITIVDTPFDIGQVQKILIQRRYSSGTTLNEFTIASANPNLKASWDTFLSASDGTKVVQTPFIEEPDLVPGDRRTYGGGNATLFGIETSIGKLPSTFTGKFNHMDPQSWAGIDAWKCEVATVYFVNDCGDIYGVVDDLATPTKFRGIVVSPKTWFISDRGAPGLEAPDFHNLFFQMDPGAMSKLHKVTPSDFDARTDLVTP